MAIKFTRVGNKDYIFIDDYLKDSFFAVTRLVTEQDKRDYAPEWNAYIAAHPRPKPPNITRPINPQVIVKSVYVFTDISNYGNRCSNTRPVMSVGHSALLRLQDQSPMKEQAAATKGTVPSAYAMHYKHLLENPPTPNWRNVESNGGVRLRNPIFYDPAGNRIRLQRTPRLS